MLNKAVDFTAWYITHKFDPNHKIHYCKHGLKQNCMNRKQ